MMSQTYLNQNDELFKSFLGRTFFNSWQYKNVPEELAPSLLNYRSLELILNGKCDLACKYCYQRKYIDEYYTNDTADDDNVLKNTKIMLDWLIKNNFYPNLEIFAGDPYTQKVGYEVTEEIISRAEAGHDNFRQLSVPTNMGFLLRDDWTRKVEEFYHRSEKVGLRYSISASVDGPFMEENRPFKNPNTVRDDNFYDKLFKFCAHYKVGFHPMIYSNNIENWINNFLWFQEMFAKYDIPWYNLYLLEVRNAEWTEDQVEEYYKFIRFIIKWVWETKLGKNFENYKLAVRNSHLFNTLSSPFSTIGRGIGCSIQSSMQVRMGDLTIFPCHRQMYESFATATFVVDDDKIVDIKAKNTEYYIMTNSTVSYNQPGCDGCAIRRFCSSACPGSSYEITGDAFSPIPSVCRLEFAKIKAIMDEIRELGFLKNYIEFMNGDHRKDMLKLIEKGVF